jgi:hypothetical protein
LGGVVRESRWGCTSSRIRSRLVARVALSYVFARLPRSQSASNSTAIAHGDCAYRGIVTSIARSTRDTTCDKFWRQTVRVATRSHVSHTPRAPGATTSYIADQINARIPLGREQVRPGVRHTFQVMARGRRSAPAEEEEQDVEVEAPAPQNGLERLQFKEPLSWRAGKPIATEVLHTRLNKLAKELGNLEQETTDASSLTQVAKELASQQLILHKDKGIRAFTASCLVDVLRICAPNAPFSPAQLKVRAKWTS